MNDPVTGIQFAWLTSMVSVGVVLGLFLLAAITSTLADIAQSLKELKEKKDGK